MNTDKLKPITVNQAKNDRDASAPPEYPSVARRRETRAIRTRLVNGSRACMQAPLRHSLAEHQQLPGSALAGGTAQRRWGAHLAAVALDSTQRCDACRIRIRAAGELRSALCVRVAKRQTGKVLFLGVRYRPCASCLESRLMSYYDSTSGQHQANIQGRQYPSGGSTFTARPASGRLANFKTNWLSSGSGRFPFSSESQNSTEGAQSSNYRGYSPDQTGRMQAAPATGSRSWSGPVNGAGGSGDGLRTPVRGYGSYGGAAAGAGPFGAAYTNPYESTSTIAFTGQPQSEMHLMIDEATRPDLPLEPPYPQFDPIIGQVLTMVRGGEITARAVKDRLKVKNERTLLLTLALLQRLMEECPNFYMHIANKRFFRRMWRLVVPDYKNSMRERFYATFDKEALQRKYATGEIDKPIYYPAVAMKVMQLIEAWGEEFERFRPYDSKGQFFVKRWRNKSRKYSFPPMPALEVPAVYRPGTSERAIELRRQRESGQNPTTPDSFSGSSPSTMKARASGAAAGSAARNPTRPRYELRDISEAADLAAALMDSAPDAGTVANDEDIASLITTCKAMLREMENMVASMDSEKSVVEAIAVNEKLLLVINRFEDICLMDPKTVLNREAAREASRTNKKPATVDAATEATDVGAMQSRTGGKRKTAGSSDEEDSDGSSESEDAAGDDDGVEDDERVPASNSSGAGRRARGTGGAAAAAAATATAAAAAESSRFTKSSAATKEDTLLWLNSDDEDDEDEAFEKERSSAISGQGRGSGASSSRKHKQPALQPQPAHSSQASRTRADTAATAAAQPPAYYIESPPSTQYGSYASASSAAQNAYGVPPGYPYMHPAYYNQGYPYAGAAWNPYGYPYAAAYGYGGAAPQMGNVPSGQAPPGASMMYGMPYGAYPGGNAYAMYAAGDAANMPGTASTSAARNPFESDGGNEDAQQAAGAWSNETTRLPAVGHTALLSLTAAEPSASHSADMPVPAAAAAVPPPVVTSRGALALQSQSRTSPRDSGLFDELWQEKVSRTEQESTARAEAQTRDASAAPDGQGGVGASATAIALDGKVSEKNPFE